MHTKGPWNYKSGYIMQGDTYIAEILVGPDCEPVETALANSRIIAASPDLLEALKAMCEEWRRHGCCDSRDVEYRAERAIAKAEGRP